ncbi:arsenate reductase ArsC [Magnetovibrio sp. PR-2]|uniref:arsenate reductase ArsC n=1 Tax=Magnetovibrio sp. PR-2 TaxID=3120356 RepID=UPI002FCE4BEE
MNDALPLHVLFLSARNACRSIMAEALLNKVGQGRFRAMSAGKKAASQIHPFAAETLKQVGYDTSEQYPKAWGVFVTPTAPRIDAVVTMDDSLEDIELPIWYSNPVRVHWGFADPEQVQGDEMERIGAYRRCFGNMEQQMLKLAGQATDGVRGQALSQILESITP